MKDVKGTTAIRTSAGLIPKGFVIFIAMLFAMPLVPGLFISDHHLGAISGNSISDHAKTRAWSPVRVGTAGDLLATSINTERNVVVDKNGYIYVVWSYNAEIWFSKSLDGGKTFTTAFDLSNDTGKAYVKTSVTPVIAYNGSAIFVAWSDQSNGATNQYISLRRSSDNGTTWVPASGVQAYTVPHGMPATDRRMTPDIAVNGSTVYVVSSNDIGGSSNILYLIISQNAGQTWGTEILVVDGSGGGGFGNNPQEPNIEVSNDNVYITYPFGFQPGDIQLKYSNRGKNIAVPGDFGNARNVWQAGPDSRYPSMVVNGSKVFLAWEEYYDNGVHTQVVFKNSSDNGQTWTPAVNQQPMNVSRSNATARSPNLVYDGDGLFCVWLDRANHAQGDLAYSEFNGAVWTKPTFIKNDTNTTAWPSAQWRKQNNRLDIVWSNGTNPWSVLYNGYAISAPPTLDWTGENGYTVDGVNPDTGTTGHTYTWRVKYTDADNYAPLTGYPMVFIDKDLNGNFNGLGEKITMNEVDANDHTYTDGKLFAYSTKLKFVGNYTYRFEAFDSTGRPARGQPANIMTGPKITSINEPPRLDWVQDWGFITDGLNPDTGFADTNFTFKIAYTDILNESSAAGFPKLYIDMNGNGTVTDPQDKVVSMLPVSPTDNTYDDGKVYYYNSTFPLGTYKYMVYAEDLMGLSAQTPIKNGPTVIARGKPPVLATTGEPGYITDGVSPTFGADTTLFNFRIKYSDPDGDLPLAAYPKVGIDMNRDKNITANEKFVMTQDDTKDTNVKDGKIYTYSASFSTLGLYKYQFEAIDINGSPSNVLTFPGVNVNSTNRAPHMTWSGFVGFEADGLDPEAGNVNSTVFHYQVIYADPDNDRPATNHPKVWIDMNLDGFESINEWFNMTDTNPASSDYANGKKYEYNRTLPLVGTYSYRFQALDVKNSPANGDPIVKKSGPIVSVQVRQLPILSFVGVGDYNGSGVSPAKGSLDTMFVYKVKYTDAQNFTPDTDYPRIYIDTDGDGFFSGSSDIMQIMQPEDANPSVVNGKVYVFKTKLPMEGTKIAYKFKAQDALGVAATGTGSIYDQVFKGPTVIINKAPLLQFIGSGAFANKGVDPSQAVTDSTFTYRVTYKDPEGDKPKDGKVYLRIDINQNRVIDPADPKIAMTEANLQDQNYAGAKEYTSQYKFTAAGSYGYRFEASDAFNNTAGGPASADYLPGPTVTAPVPNRAPTLTFTGEANFKNIGVNPLSALKGTKFTFRVMYTDLDNDAPGNVTLTIGGQKYPMSAFDATTNYAAGKIFTVDVPLSKAQTYTYTFDVKNAIGQTATLGPVDGPVVTEKAAQSKAQVLPDMLWLVVLIVIALIVAIIGYLIGARRKKEPEQHQHMPQTRQTHPPQHRRPDGLKEAPMVPLTSADVDEAPKKAGPVIEKAKPDEKPGPAETKIDTGGAKSDLKASSEQPATATEDAKKPEEKPGPPIEAETKTDLKEQHGAVEAPASDKDLKEGETTAKPEEKPAGEKKDNVDDEIDSILAKLEK